MKAPPFRYHRPDTVDEALSLLAEHGDEAKVLAGGQSLIPLMGLRMGRPAHVVDIGSIPDLDSVEVGADGSLTLGPLVRQEQALRSPVVRDHAPLLTAALSHVAHRAIRTRGTVLGSIAHADPAAELPAVALAARATLTASSIRGSRIIDAHDFFEGYLTTALSDDEMLTSASFPTWPDNTVCSVVEEARRHGDFALVSLALMLTVDTDRVTAATLSFSGVGSTPVRAHEAERSLIGTTADTDAIEAAARLVSEHLDPPADIHGSSAYRRHLAGTLTRRGIASALASIGVPA